MLGYVFNRCFATATRSSASRRERERQLWADFVSTPNAWWDNRLEKKTDRHPDFRHKISKEPLWLDSAYKPVWVDHHFIASAEFLKQNPSGIVGYDDLFQSLCKQGHIEKALCMLSYVEELCDTPPDQLFWGLLKASIEDRNLGYAQRVHGFMVYHGLDVFGSLGEYLVTALVKCGGLQDALRVFTMSPQVTVVSWTVVIAGFVDCNKCREAFTMYEHMRHRDVDPNEYTFVALLRACAITSDFDKGKDLHNDIRRLGFESNIFVASTLVTMYGKCGSVSDAEDVFCGLPKHDIVAWTAMLSVYVERGCGQKAIQLYRQMQGEAVGLDDQAYVMSVQACDKLLEEKFCANAEESLLARKMCLEIGRAMHADVKNMGVSSNSFVGSTLVSMYGKLGSISEGEHVFCRLLQQCTVSWNALLSAYVDQNFVEKALILYCQMRKKFAQPDERSFAILLQACCMLAEKAETLGTSKESAQAMYLEIGHALYADAQKEGLGLDVVICSTLVSLYGKCGRLAEAEDVFQGLLDCDVALWNVMLSAYADAGQAGKALHLSKQLQEEGIVPNDATLVRILQASSETSSIDICKQSHTKLLSSGRDVSPLMGNTLVHAYGSCASMVQAREVFDGLRHPEGNGVSLHDGNEEGEASKHGAESESLTSSPTTLLEPQTDATEGLEVDIISRKVDPSSKSAPITASNYYQREVSSRTQELALESPGQKKLSMYALPSPSNASGGGVATQSTGHEVDSSAKPSSGNLNTAHIAKRLSFLGRPIEDSRNQSLQESGGHIVAYEQITKQHKKDERLITFSERTNDADLKKAPNFGRSYSHSGPISNKRLPASNKRQNINNSSSISNHNEQIDPLYKSGPVSRSPMSAFLSHGSKNVSPPLVSPPQISELHKLPLPPPSPVSANLAYSAPLGKSTPEVPPPKSGPTSPLPPPPPSGLGARSLSIPASSSRSPKSEQGSTDAAHHGFSSPPLKPLTLPVTTSML